MTTTTRRRRPGPLVLAGLAALAAVALGPSRAWALDTEVTSSTAAQGYALRSPFGDPVLFRRRVTQTLGLGAYEKLDRDRPDGPQFLLKLRLRLDADVGVDGVETSFRRGDPASRYVPGLSETPVDLMYGYVEGRRLAGGWLTVRAGRQYVADALGWWSFDGGLARVQAPYVSAEVYGGFEQRGGLPLSLGRYERGGVARGDRSSLDGAPDAVPAFLEASRAPAFGLALETNTPTWVHARVDYRRVHNTGAVRASYLPGPGGQIRTFDGTRVSSERVGAAVDATIGTVGAARAGAVYDLYSQIVSSTYAGLDAFINRRLTAGADFDFFKPTFDGDSIWNWFTQTPITSLTGRAALQLDDRLDLALNAGVRWWQTDDDPAAPATTIDRVGRAATQGPLADPSAAAASRLTDLLGSAHGRYRWSRGRRGRWSWPGRPG
ncbi:MAG: hypothetical protein EOO75_15305, partial [Myxococcales bacterium]